MASKYGDISRLLGEKDLPFAKSRGFFQTYVSGRRKAFLGGISL